MESSSTRAGQSQSPAIFTQQTFITLAIIILGTLVQFGWVAIFISEKVALVNLFPAAALITIWTLFISHHYSDRPFLRVVLLLPVLILSLRLQVTWFQGTQVLNWLLCLFMAGVVLRKMLPQFSDIRAKFFLLATVVLLLANTAHHIGLNSPYTYTFRMMNGQPSGFTGVDNNRTWECEYNGSSNPVHCDARHFIASEKIFTEPNFDPSYSVVLQRFLHGYLNSLAGMENSRYWVNLGLNFTFWFFACVCVYRICRLLKLDDKVAGLSMLCCASGVGFIDMVAQPAPYLITYAYSPIALWATLEIIYGQLKRQQTILMVLLIGSVVMAYDAYNLILACTLLLFLHKKKLPAVAVMIVPVLFTLTWRYFSMNMALGTQGSLASHGSTISLLMIDINAWLDVAKTFNIAEFFRLSIKGTVAYFYGNLIIGALAAWAYIFGLTRPKSTTPEKKTLFAMLIALNALVLLATIFVVPQMIMMSPATGMQPRIAFYSYPINMIALVLISVHWFKKYAWITPAILLIVVNLNITGLATVDMLFDYGRVGLYWK